MSDFENSVQKVFIVNPRFLISKTMYNGRTYTVIVTMLNELNNKTNKKPQIICCPGFHTVVTVNIVCYK